MASGQDGGELAFDRQVRGLVPERRATTPGGPSWRLRTPSGAEPARNPSELGLAESSALEQSRWR